MQIVFVIHQSTSEALPKVAWIFKFLSTQHSYVSFG